MYLGKQWLVIATIILYEVYKKIALERSHDQVIEVIAPYATSKNYCFSR